jgi:large subunit ribosomal protein L30
MPEKKAAASAEKGKKKAPRKATTVTKPRKAPAAAAAAAPPVAAAGARLRVKQVRSGIGHAATYRRTLASLGLKHHQYEVLVRDHPSVRGMLRKVAHLVRVETVEA